MPLRTGKRVALAVVAVGLLLIAGAGLAFREELVQMWRTWREEKVTREVLSRPFPEELQQGLSQFVSSGRLPIFLIWLSQKAGIKFSYGFEVATKTIPKSLPPVKGKSIESVLRLVLASADPNLDYTIKGDTVVIGLKATGPEETSETPKKLR